MLTTLNKQYKLLNKCMLKNITEHQAKEFIADFEVDSNNNILMPYYDKNYDCNDVTPVCIDSKIQAISIFSGGGGLDIGAQLAGVKVISSLDNDKDCISTMKANVFFDHTTHLNEDVFEVNGCTYSETLKKNMPERLILIGGPPCQPFSKAGYWVTNDKRKAHDDPRNMIGQFFRIINEIKPDGFLFENVESLLHPTNKIALNTIIDYIHQLGYHYTLLKVNAANYGIPQKRKRVFFLASKKKIQADLPQTHGSKKEIAINPKLLEYERVIDWIGVFDDKYCNDETLSISGRYEYELRAVPPGKNYIALSEKAGHPSPKFIAGKRYWSSLLKLHPNLPSWTIIASPGHWEGPFHWNNRRLSNKEVASIQTFPVDYIFCGSVRSQRKIIGNAVPPLLGKLVVEELCRWL